MPYLRDMTTTQAPIVIPAQALSKSHTAPLSDEWLFGTDPDMTRMPCGESIDDHQDAVTAHVAECHDCALELACDTAADRAGWALR